MTPAARRAALAVAAAVLAGRAGAAPPDPVLRPVRVAPRVYVVQGAAGVASPANRGFNSNAAFVVTPEGVVVVDALGTPALGRALVRAIRGVTDRPIRRVILTHYHADHVYGLAALKAAGAEIWGRAEGRAYLEGEAGRQRLEERRRDLPDWFDATTEPIPADRWLVEDTSFVMGGVRFELTYLGPAHAPDDLIVTLPRDGVVFSGDIIFGGRLPYVGEADGRRWLAAIDGLLRRHPRLLVPGHGSPTRDPAKHLALTRDYLLYLRRTMGAAVQDLVPFDEAYAATDWSRYAKLPAFEAANRVNAYGTYLEMERELLDAGK